MKCPWGTWFIAAVAAPSIAIAEDRGAIDYLVSPPIVRSGSGLQHTFAMRWEHSVRDWLELGLGAELGLSGGHDSEVTRVAALPGLAIVERTGPVTLRIEQQIGWQLVDGKVTLDAIPLTGTETRSFHEELTGAIEVPVTADLALRGRAGVMIDGIYPAGHSSLRVTACIGVSFVFGFSSEVAKR